MLLYGAAAAFRIPIELLPSLPLPGITVVTSIEGRSAEEVETMVTEPLERGFLGLDGLAGLSSVSEEGISTISLEFALGTDAALCFAETAELADEVYPRLPDEASKPALSSSSRTEEGPLIRTAVEPRGVPFEELAASIGGLLTGRLLHTREIGRVVISGSLIPRIMVRVDSGILRAAGIPPSQLAEILETHLAEYFLGTVENRNRYRSLRLTGGIASTGDISSLPVPSRNGYYTGLTLGDVASVTAEYTAGGSWAYRNGKPFLGIEIYRNPGVPTLDAARGIRRQLALLEEEYPYLSFSVIEDGSRHLRAAVRDFLIAVLMSTLSTLFVLSLFYSSFKAGLIILASLPCSLVPTILTLHLLGKGLNTVSLAGMVMGVGLIVDCSILVFHRSLLHLPGEDLHSLLPALTASTVTTALVFIPVMFLPGITSALFRDLALTVTILLFYSLAAAVVLLPTLITLFPQALRTHTVRRRCMRTAEGYLEILKRFGPRFVFPGLPLVFAGALVCGITLPKIPLPEDRRASIVVRGEFFSGRGEEDNRRSCESLSRKLMSLPGNPEVLVEGDGYTVKCLIAFPRKADSSRPGPGELDAFFAAVLPEEGVVRYSSGPPPSPLTPFFLGAATREYLLLAESRTDLSSRITSICTGLVESGLCASAECGLGVEGFRSSFVLDPALVRLTGSDPETVSRSVSLKDGEKNVGTLKTSSGAAEVLCTFTPGQSESTEAVVPTSSGTVSLEKLGHPEETPSLMRLERFDGSPAAEIRIRSSASGKLVEGFISRAGGGIEPVSRDADLERSIRNVFAALGLSVLLIFFYLLLHYNGFRIPLLLTSFLPVPAAGSLFLLALFGRSINIGSVLGILITLGTSLNTMIVTADGRTESILPTAAARTYPLAATVATTVCAAIPGIILSEYAFQRDTAVAVAGGILFGSGILMMSFPRVLSGGSRNKP